jgi:hypothetical protein
MDRKQKFTVSSLVITLVVNGLLLAAVAFMGVGAAVFGVGAVLSLVLWFAVRQVALPLIEGAPASEALPPKPSREALPPKPAAPPKPTEPREASAIQILSILQRKGRLIDFLQEDLSQYQDAQIGAAVRNIHEGCKQALDEYVDLEPVFEQAEGSTVTVQPGFDPHAIRLTGNIAGDPPFKGALRHRGWRVARVALPERVQEQAMIVAAAEVEVNG